MNRRCDCLLPPRARRYERCGTLPDSKASRVFLGSGTTGGVHRGSRQRKSAAYRCESIDAKRMARNRRAARRRLRDRVEWSANAGYRRLSAGPKESLSRQFPRWYVNRMLRRTSMDSCASWTTAANGRHRISYGSAGIYSVAPKHRLDCSDTAQPSRVRQQQAASYCTILAWRNARELASWQQCGPLFIC